jgi:hypothetical protein
MEIKEFNRIKEMLNSTKEDMEVAIQNVVNLDLDGMRVAILAKNLTLDKRSDFIKELSIEQTKVIEKFEENINNNYGMSKTIINLSWQKIYDLIKTDYSNDQELKDLFEYEFKNELNKGLINDSIWNFLTDIKLEIKW